MRNPCQSVLLSLAALFLAASPASAQSGKFDALTHYVTPSSPMPDGVIELPDGRLYGMMNGGIGSAGIVQITPDGAGGYTSTLVHAFGFNEPQPIFGQGDGTPLKAIVVGGDGKVYYLVFGGLMRFDPDTNATSPISSLPANVGLLSVGTDGHTLFGGANDPGFTLDGHIFSYDLATHAYRDLTTVPGQISGVQQMPNGQIVVLSWAQHSVSTTWLTRIDPLTGTNTQSQIPDAVFATPLEAGDDGAYYFATDFITSRSPFTLVQRVERLDPGCFCLSTLHEHVVSGNPFRSLTGLHQGRIYATTLAGNTVRLTVTPGSPTQEDTYTTMQPYGIDLLPSGRLVMYSQFVGTMPTYLVDTATFDPASGTPTLIEQTSAPDGTGPFPDRIIAVANGQVYALDDSGNITRVDSVAHTRTVVTTLTDGSPWPFVAMPDGWLYASYDSGSGGGILRFDPATNSVENLRRFTVDNVGIPNTPDGASPGPLSLGRDGWLYGIMSLGNTDQTWFTGSLFKFDPVTQTFVTLYSFQAATDGVFQGGRLIEGASGVWYGADVDQTNFCGVLFKFDTHTSTFTPLHTYDPATEPCGPTLWGATPEGTPVMTASGADFTIATIDPVSDAVTPVHVFTPGQPLQLGSGITVASDGNAYMTVIDTSTGNQTFERLNLQTGTLTSIVGLARPYGNLDGLVYFGPLIGDDGRLYGVSTDVYVFALGILDPLPVAPANGPFGGMTSLSATMKTLGVPVPGRTITFTLNGNAVGTAVTNAQGIATLDHVGLNGIAVGSYASAIGASFAGDEQFPSTSGTGALTVIDVPTPGLMIGNGFIRDGRSRYEFAFIVRENAAGVDRGALVLRVSPANHVFVSTSYTSVVFSDDPTIRPGRSKKPQVDTVSFAGTGTWDGHPGYRFEAFAQDRGEPGRHREAFSITVYDSANHVVGTVNGDLDGGNVQSVRIHR